MHNRRRGSQSKSEGRLIHPGLTTGCAMSLLISSSLRLARQNSCFFYTYRQASLPYPPLQSGLTPGEPVIVLDRRHQGKG